MYVKRETLKATWRGLTPPGFMALATSHYLEKVHLTPPIGWLVLPVRNISSVRRMQCRSKGWQGLAQSDFATHLELEPHFPGSISNQPSAGSYPNSHRPSESSDSNNETNILVTLSVVRGRGLQSLPVSVVKEGRKGYWTVYKVQCGRKMSGHSNYEYKCPEMSEGFWSN